MMEVLKMVHGTVHLANGDIVLIQAEDMLSALKRATEMYQGQAISMDFKTVEVSNTDGRKTDVYTEDY
jgi:hypothetical protein